VDYQGTENDDIIDQSKLGIPDWQFLYGSAGNDTIIFKTAHAVGGPGNDAFYGTSRWSNVSYWNSSSGVKVNLAKGTAEDGFGGSDTFFNITSVHGSRFDDIFIGSARNEYFHGGAGNNSFIGGGGSDEVLYYGVKSTEAQITYDAPNDTFTVTKLFSNGDRGIDTLKGISTISFTGEGADNIYLTKDSFVPVGGFLRLPGGASFHLPYGSGVSQIKAGDFNGDGATDLYIASQMGTGTAPSPILIFLGDGTGRFTDGKTAVFPNAPDIIVGGGRTLIADFNKDGLSDVFQFDFGNDAPPWSGGLNHLFLSSVEKKQLANESATLNQKTATNHAGSAGDVNGDGYLDVLANTMNLGNVLFINDGTGHFKTRMDLFPKQTVNADGTGNPRTNTSSGIVDINLDGKLDLILGKWEEDASLPATQILLNDGAGNFTKSVPINLPSSGVYRENVLDIKAIDLNGDERPDLMLSVTNGGGDSTTYGTNDYYTTPYIQLLVNKGDGTFNDETAQRLPLSVQAALGKGWFDTLTSVDFNHDGHADILASVGGFTSSFVLMNQGNGTFKQGWFSAIGGRTVTADVNRDGSSDLVSVMDTSISVVLNQFENGHIYKANFGGDSLLGSSGNDRFFASNGNDVFNGNGGIDTVIYAGSRADYVLSKSTSGSTVASQKAVGGMDTLLHTERLAFADATIALDIDGNAGQAYRLYQAAFDRKPDLAGLGAQINGLDSGMTLLQISQNFINSAEFQQRYGANPSNDAFVTLLYANVLHRTPDAAGFAVQVNALNSGMSRAQLLVNFSESNENFGATIVGIQNGIDYIPIA
jgi:hypothetical protein